MTTTLAPEVTDLSWVRFSEPVKCIWNIRNATGPDCPEDATAVAVFSCGCENALCEAHRQYTLEFLVRMDGGWFRDTIVPAHGAVHLDYWRPVS